MKVCYLIIPEPSDIMLTFRYPAEFDPELLNTASALYLEVTAAITAEVSVVHF